MSNVAVDAGYTAFGDAASYRPADGGAATPCVIVTNEQLQEFGSEAIVAGSSLIINVRRSELPMRPRRGDTFTLDEDGTVYNVDRSLNQTRHEYQVLAVELDTP